MFQNYNKMQRLVVILWLLCLSLVLHNKNKNNNVNAYTIISSIHTLTNRYSYNIHVNQKQCCQYDYYYLNPIYTFGLISERIRMISRNSILSNIHHCTHQIQSRLLSANADTTSTSSTDRTPLQFSDLISVPIGIDDVILSNDIIEQQKSFFSQTKSQQSESSQNSQQSNIVKIVNTMPTLLNNTTIKNKYYLLRHGQSIANVNEIISSNYTQLSYSNKHGLTELGYEQGIQSSTNLLDILSKTVTNVHDKLIFISSPYARARQTAVACINGLLQNNGTNSNTLRQLGIQMNTTSSIYISNLLIERYFGTLDNEAIYTYAYVWPLDKFNVTHTTFHVESVAAVCTRIQQLILQLESIFEPSSQGTMNHIVLVSHADVLQIAQLYGAHHTNVGTFSSYRFKNGEVRSMLIGQTDHLPDPLPLEKPDRTTKTTTTIALTIPLTTKAVT